MLFVVICEPMASVCQDKFVEMGGVRHLTALLHSRSERCVQEAMTAISYIVQDSEHNKHAIIANHGCVQCACNSVCLYSLALIWKDSNSGSIVYYQLKHCDSYPLW